MPQVDLSSSPALLTEWFVLIEQLDVLLQEEVKRRAARASGRRPRSNTLPVLFQGTVSRTPDALSCWPAVPA